MSKDVQLVVIGLTLVVLGIAGNHITEHQSAMLLTEVVALLGMGIFVVGLVERHTYVVYEETAEYIVDSLADHFESIIKQKDEELEASGVKPEYVIDPLFGFEHHHNCKFRDIEQEAKEHLVGLLALVEYEAKMGDGIPEDFFEVYAKAKVFTEGIIV